ncbi:MAG: type toxin-antitoxin system HicA family toxin [Gammaproteobacteria bacterium]|jgi:hypothetical protein|nr:type toxin-antitoxin system HicA family toxin [Gammaproteobacteria bacterium]MCE3238515.1 type toxin-antitoxin system HicA family toxin [Gammaproteobacteria bacterium]
MKLNDLERYLHKNNCIKKREGANHSIWENSSNSKIAPVPRHREIKDLLVQKICKQLEIPIH